MSSDPLLPRCSNLRPKRAFHPCAHAPDISRVTPSTGAQATRDESICMLRWQYVATGRTNAQDDAGRLTTDGAHCTGRIETEHIEDVPKIEADGLHVERRLGEGMSRCWHVLRSKCNVGD